MTRPGETILLPEPTRIGRTLGTLRIAQGHTRVAVAHALAIATGTGYESARLNLWRWETGRAQPTLESLPALLEFLAVDLALVTRVPR